MTDKKYYATTSETVVKDQQFYLTYGYTSDGPNIGFGKPLIANKDFSLLKEFQRMVLEQQSKIQQALKIDRTPDPRFINNYRGTNADMAVLEKVFRLVLIEQGFAIEVPPLKHIPVNFHLDEVCIVAYK